MSFPLRFLFLESLLAAQLLLVEGSLLLDELSLVVHFELGEALVALDRLLVVLVRGVL